MSSVNVAIDGPVGCGKSTLAKRLSSELGLIFLDTGAMYRAVALHLKQKEIISAEQFTLDQLKDCELGFDEQNAITLAGKSVEAMIRTPEIGSLASVFSVLPEVREFLVKQQREMVSQGGYIAEGRDIGTHVMPDAFLKIYLTASLDVRARRRLEDYRKQGMDMAFEEVKKEVQKRDERDMNREVSPLVKTPDAIEVDSSDLDIETLLRKVISLYQERKGSE